MRMDFSLNFFNVEKNVLLQIFLQYLLPTNVLTFSRVTFSLLKKEKYQA